MQCLLCYLQTGCWGEQLVTLFLEMHHAGDSAASRPRVVWINAEKETGAPYDIKLE